MMKGRSSTTGPFLFLRMRYFRNFASVHKTYSDALVRAMKGSRADIAATLKASVEAIHNGATTN